MFARPPREVTIALAEFFVDGKSIGKVTERPYKLKYDTSDLADGEHVVKAVGKDAQGKEVWAASVKAVAGPAAAPPRISPRPGGAASNPPGQPGVTPASPNPSSPAGRVPVPATNPASAMQLIRTYNNAEFGFSVSYPQGWVASDKSEEMKPKEQGNVWIVFGTAPVDQAAVVVNVKRRQLQKDTDADIFAKYNSYVKKWKRTTRLGSPAFVTTDGKPENKRVIHRAIIIKDGCAWMLNCIDTTGRPGAGSKSLFDSIVNTLRTLKPAHPTVTITEAATVD